MNNKIRKNDKVMIIAGKDKGKIGKVLKILRKKERILVENVNKIHRHTKANPYKSQAGGIIEKEAPVHISNVAVLCTSCTKPTRVGYRKDNEGKKVRFCKKCNENLE